MSLRKNEEVERVGCHALQDIHALIRNAQQVIVLVAATDVTVVNMSIPPLPLSKLRAALPNSIEDKLLANVADSVVVCSTTTHSDGTRGVAVANRAWLDKVAQTLRELGAQRIRILPEQLCLASANNGVNVALGETETGIALTLRLSEQTGMGITLRSPDELLATLRAIVPVATIHLYVATAAVSRYQTLLAQDEAIEVGADNGTQWQANLNAPDFISGLDNASSSRWNWQPWRWPLALAGAVLFINIAGLNFDWWQKNREAKNLNATIKQIYLTAYPNEKIILDPLLQMRQKVAAAQGSADDFSRLMAEFGQAWARDYPASTISNIEYHDHSLSVHLKSELAPAAMQSALATRGLTLDATTNMVWQIRSQK